MGVHAPSLAPPARVEGLESGGTALQVAAGRRRPAQRGLRVAERAPDTAGSPAGPAAPAAPPARAGRWAGWRRPAAPAPPRRPAADSARRRVELAAGWPPPRLVHAAVSVFAQRRLRPSSGAQPAAITGQTLCQGLLRPCLGEAALLLPVYLLRHPTECASWQRGGAPHNHGAAATALLTLRPVARPRCAPAPSAPPRRAQRPPAPPRAAGAWPAGRPSRPRPWSAQTCSSTRRGAEPPERRDP
jgi:hypothetical protein